MSKFTEGKWSYHRTDFGVEVRLGHNFVIASVSAYPKGFEANGHLIAAAPEMFELLGMAKCPNCDGSGAYYDNMGDVCQCQWCDERTKVIAKARGES